MAVNDLADLLGAKARAVRWERPLLFFGALFVAAVVDIVLGPSYSTAADGTTSVHFFSVAPAASWLFAFLSLLQVALAFAALRLIGQVWLAVLAVTITYPILSRPFWYLAFTHMTGAYGDPPPFFSSMLVQSLVSSAVSTAAFYAAVAAAVSLIPRLLPALLAGAVSGGIVGSLARGVVSSIASERPLSTATTLWNTAFNMGGDVVFALALWLALYATADPAGADGAPAPRMRRGFYLGLLAVGYLVPLVTSTAVLVYFGFDLWSRREAGPALLVVALSLPFLVLGAVVFSVFVYRMWAAIQDGRTHPSAGQALGFLFIPFFNLYWVFRAFPGFAREYNAFAERHALPVPPLGSALPTAWAIAALGSSVPVVGIVATPVSLVLLWLMVSRVCAAVNRLPV